jgi:hypothetical protein
LGGLAVVQLTLKDRDHVFVFPGFVEMFLSKDLEEQDVFVASLRRFLEPCEECIDGERGCRCLGVAALGFDRSLEPAAELAWFHTPRLA